MRSGQLLLLALLCGGLGLGTVAGCGGRHAPAAKATSLPAAAGVNNPRAQLAAHAAAAKDRRYIADYTLSRDRQRDQAVTATLAADGTWRVDVQGGALSGAADVAIVGRSGWQYQCTLRAAGGAATAQEGCVKLARMGTRPPDAADPLVQHPFTTWLDVFTDPTVAVTVTVTTPLPGVSGTCFAVESTTVTLAPPIESSVACFDEQGTVTGARAEWGTLVRSGTPAAPPETAALPGSVVARDPLPTSAPPAPATPASVPSGLPTSPIVPPPR
jgi:hypothetical protein